MKKTFINNEIWILTFGGAFQRANVYTQNYPEKTRTAFRKALREEVEKIVKDYYSVQVSEKEHIKHIKSIVSFSEQLKIEGEIIPINFGVAQKMLNLYLKYLWCLGELNHIPPHFPVDRVIQEELNKVARKHNIAPQVIKPWTQFKDASNYGAVIEFAKTIRNGIDEFKQLSLAELELKLFDRR